MYFKYILVCFFSLWESTDANRKSVKTKKQKKNMPILDLEG